jgi:flagellar basal-body rod protein FlgF
MDKALYVAMSGGKHINRAQTVHANNMANANTLGFRADFAQARSAAVYYGDGLPTRAYALAENPGTDFSFGSLNETGRDLDVALDGEGWIAVQGDDGREAYTRAGSLRVTPLGQLQTADGRQVLGDAGPLTLPPYEKVQIGDDGTISVQAQGQAPNVLAEVGRIKLVQADGTQLEKGGDGLMRLRDGQPPLPADASVRLQSGFLEGSNVNIVDEFTNIIALARQFDLQLKLMRTAEDNSSSATRLLQHS